MSDSATNFSLLNLERQVRDLQTRVAALEADNKAHVTAGALQALASKVAIDMSELADVVNRVEEKVSFISDPKETLALIGVDDLRTIKTHIRQLIVLIQEHKEMRTQLVDMLAAYDFGQATTI